ncbi:MAG TPA: glycosyltransferase family 2 protein [Planctomycetota bacterium]|nr:glycosyltransferase family 2 protein [Planctomycetota bacterium]
MIGDAARSHPAAEPDDAREAGRTPISACVICYQEQDRIAACVDSLAACDETVVVDSGSTDGTAELAAAHGARVLLHRPFPGHREQKQFAVEQAQNDWVLCLDADERLTPELQARLLALQQAGLRGAAYEMPRRNHYLGAVVRAGLFWPDRKIRLFDRRRARWGGTNPHDHVEVQTGGEVTVLQEPIEHLSYRDFRHHLRTVDSFTRIAARELAAAGRRTNLFDLLVRPPSVLVKSLLLKRGFRDGWRGVVIAGMAAYTDWLKYWRLFRLRHRGTGA